ncbi:hypothetical protein SAY86_018429 [Trapa natans]|uniref:DUF4378 domain-containing protein n=1 Tax=Trapa natans TaxID=22666 RepID=A0AAN7LD92_TRANT|nr:hypothetical protein SAY86_018429 [Trapa natans]
MPYSSDGMAQKHLRELLCEDQEPFLLESYIADRRLQFSRFTKARKLTKPAPRSPSNFFAGGLCKSVCLFSVLPDSPDPRKSPLFDFAAATASPRKSPNFLRVPAKTAALLLEAAVRIQQKKASPIKKKSARKGLIGSIMRRLIHGKRVSPPGELLSDRRKSVSKLKSGVWSENNGERPLDSASTSCSDSIELVVEAEEEEVYATFNESLPGSPFRFVLGRSPSSSSERTPELASPTTSPAHHGKVEIDHQNVGCSKKMNLAGKEEEKEQCSPVSVLDPLFEDGHEGEEEEGGEGFHYECRFSNVQRAKQQLLEKLRRFEKLAGLDPVDLEKRMFIGLEGDDDDEEEERAPPVDAVVTQVLESKIYSMKRALIDTKRAVDLDTVDMIVEEELRSEIQGWRPKQHLDEVAVGIEFAVCSILVEELLEELY